MDLINSSLGQIGSADVKSHGETFDDHRSYLQGLSPRSYCESQGMFESPSDVEVGALSSSPYLGNVVRFEVVLVEA